MEENMEFMKVLSLVVMAICGVVVAFGIMKMVYDPPDTSIDVMHVGDGLSNDNMS